MEATGVVLGVAGLAGLFSTIVDCFQLIQRGRSCDRDYRILETKLDNQELRLTAWGRASGLFDCEGPDHPLNKQPEIEARIRGTLRCIEAIFQDERELRKRYGLRTIEGSSSPISVPILARPASHDMGKAPTRHTLGSFFSRKKQQRSINFSGSLRWAISDKDSFSELVQHLKDFNDDLEAMTRMLDIPSKQRAIVELEVEEIAEMATLEDVAAVAEDDTDVVSDTASQRLLRIREGSTTMSIRSLSIRSSRSSCTVSFGTARSAVTETTYYTATSSNGTTLSFASARSRISSAIAAVLPRTPSKNGRIAAALTSPSSTTLNAGLLKALKDLDAKPQVTVPRFKLVALGDKNCCSNELLSTFKSGFFNQYHVETVLEDCIIPCSVDDKEIDIELSDMGGQGQYDFLRRGAYQSAHVILLCFDASSPTFVAATELLATWAGEFDGKKPLILVGIDKSTTVGYERDLETGSIMDSFNPSTQKVSLRELERWAIAQRLGAIAYIHCNVVTGEGVEEVLELATRAATGILPQAWRRPGRFSRISNVLGRLRVTNVAEETAVA